MFYIALFLFQTKFLYLVEQHIIIFETFSVALDNFYIFIVKFLFNYFSLEEFYYSIILSYSYVAEKLSEELSNIRIRKDDGIIKFFKTEVIKKKFYDEDVEVVKCYAESFKDYDVLLDKIKELGLEKKESDIKHIKRYLTEKSISPLILSEVSGEVIEDHSNGIVIKGEVKQKDSEFLKNPKILAFDIEVYGDFSVHQKHKQDPIIMISF